VGSALATQRFWKKLGLFLIAWQAIIFITAGGSHLIGLRASESQPNESDRQLIASLLAPTEADQKASVEEISQLQSVHNAAVTLWHEALKKLVAGKKPEDVLPALESQAPQTPFFYDSQTRWILSDLSRRDRTTLFVTAVGYGCADESLLSELREIQNSNSTDSTSKREAFDACRLALILQGRFSEAAEETDAQSRRLDTNSFEAEQKYLHKLAASPDDFAARLALAETLSDHARSGHLATGYISFIWELWANADTPSQQASILRLLASAYQQQLDLKSARMLYTASARLSAIQSEAPLLQPSYLLMRLAQTEQELGNTLLAAHIYGVVAEKFPESKEWGVSVFNQGALLREAGYAAFSAKALARLLNSSVNDQDPSGYLREIYQNYRHNAAEEIARSYQDRLNFPQMYYWQCIAISKHAYQSDCGTCLESNRWHESLNLLSSAIKAGPLFITANFALYPGRNWLLLCLILLAATLLFYKHRRKRIML
jgi:hypothetical protein